MKIINKFNIGDIVFLKTCIEQVERIVLEIILYDNGIKYVLGYGEVYSTHYEFEITKEKDIIKKMSEE